MRYCGSGVQVTTDGKTATYHLWTGPPLTVWHEGEPFDLGDDDVKLSVTQVQAGPPPTQPAGREPRRRGP